MLREPGPQRGLHARGGSHPLQRFRQRRRLVADAHLHPVLRVFTQRAAHAPRLSWAGVVVAWKLRVSLRRTHTHTETRTNHIPSQKNLIFLNIFFFSCVFLFSHFIFWCTHFLPPVNNIYSPVVATAISYTHASVQMLYARRYESLVYNEMNGLENLYLTSTIVDTELSVGPFTGHELAHCFGFTDQVYMWTQPSTYACV